MAFLAPLLSTAGGQAALTAAAEPSKPLQKPQASTEPGSPPLAGGARIMQAGFGSPTPQPSPSPQPQQANGLPSKETAQQFATGLQNGPDASANWAKFLEQLIR